MTGWDWLWAMLIGMGAQLAWTIGKDLARKRWRTEDWITDRAIIMCANPDHWMSGCTRCMQTSDFLPDQTAAKNWIFTHYDEKHRKGGAT